eukprot:scaffold1266_cov134-Pinguiococcus_pyrenoidosus.AAC.4
MPPQCTSTRKRQPILAKCKVQSAKCKVQSAKLKWAMPRSPSCRKWDLGASPGRADPNMT